MTTPNNPRKYLGTNQYLTPFVSRNRQPTSSDVKQPETGNYYPVTCLWQVGKNPTTGLEGQVFILTKIVANVSYWELILVQENDTNIIEYAVLVGGPDEEILSITPVASTTKVLVSGGVSANPSWQDISALGLVWNSIGTSQTLVIDNGYFCTSGAALSLLLPATSVVGESIVIYLDGATQFSVTQNAGQSIRLGNQVTTVGVGGSLSSTQQGDSVTLICKEDDVSWAVLGSHGNLTIV
jgi:hypothetical protein